MESLKTKKFLGILTILVAGFLTMGNKVLTHQEGVSRDPSRFNFMTINPMVWKANWHQIKGHIKARWGQLTDDDLMEIEGHQEKLIGVLQKKYVFNEEKLHEEVRLFYNDLLTSLSQKQDQVPMFFTLNPNIWKSRWHQIKGTLKEKWGYLTEDDLLILKGNQEKLNAVIQKRYGIDQEMNKLEQDRRAQAVKKEIDDFYKLLGDDLYEDKAK